MNSRSGPSSEDKCRRDGGQSLMEMTIVMVILLILALVALPQLRSARNATRWSGVQREVVSELRNARQLAMSQRQPLTFRFDNTTKLLTIYGGSFGVAGATRNRAVRLARGSLDEADLIYGRPTGAPTAALADATNLTALTSNQVEITFQPDGSVLDAGNNPVATGLFFYHSRQPSETAFAITVLGFGGRVKLWRYNQGTNSYAE